MASATVMESQIEHEGKENNADRQKSDHVGHGGFFPAAGQANRKLHCLCKLGG